MGGLTLSHFNYHMENIKLQYDGSYSIQETTKEQLQQKTLSHINDVRKGIAWCIERLKEVGDNHDHTKLSNMDLFYRDFKNYFQTNDWFEMHKREQRHHIADKGGAKKDVDLFDVLEFVVDGVVSGVVRQGSYYYRDLPDGLLQQALYNTIDKLLNSVELEGNTSGI